MSSAQPISGRTELRLRTESAPCRRLWKDKRPRQSCHSVASAKPESSSEVEVSASRIRTGRLFSCAKPLRARVAAQGIGPVSVLSGKSGRGNAPQFHNISAARLFLSLEDAVHIAERRLTGSQDLSRTRKPSAEPVASARSTANPASPQMQSSNARRAQGLRSAMAPSVATSNPVTAEQGDIAVAVDANFDRAKEKPRPVGARSVQLVLERSFP
jgi:hypothetical protein